jgi:class 3 adenylate cyclase
VRTLGVEIRAGVHSGEVQVTPDGVRGIAVRTAARLMGAAGPGEVLVVGDGPRPRRRLRARVRGCGAS